MIFGWGLAEIKIGDGTYLNRRSEIIAGADITIGSNSAITWDVKIISDDMHVIESNNKQATNRSPIEIRDNVWLGANRIVLKGIKIDSGSVVAPGSVVARGDYPSGSLIAGNPARVVRSDIHWRHMTDEEKTSNWSGPEISQVSMS